MSQQKHWLYREENRRTLWYIVLILAVISVIPEFFMHHHGNFEAQGINLDSQSGFYPWIGFVSCAVLILIAKLFSYVIKRKDDYYDE